MDTPGPFTVSRAKPADAEAIAEFVARATRGRVYVVPRSVMERFGSKGLWLVRGGKGRIVGLAGWWAENLIARIDDFLVFPIQLYASAGKALVANIEKAALDLQCEVSILFVPPRASPRVISFFESCGYKRPEPRDLPRVWREPVQEAMERGRYIMLRQLREDLVLRPL